MNLPENHVILKEPFKAPKAANPTALVRRGGDFYYVYGLTSPAQKPWPKITMPDGTDGHQPHILLNDPECLYNEDRLWRALNPSDPLEKRLWGTPDPLATRLTLGAILGNQLVNGHVWLVLVGPPSCGKTHTVHLVSSLEGTHPPVIHYCDRFTASAIWSAKSFEDSLLTSVTNGGTLILSDASTLWSRPGKSHANIMEILRRVYDGEFEDHTSFGKRRWTGKVGMIVCATPVIHKQRRLGQTFGDRFMYYVMRSEYCAILSEADLGAFINETYETQAMRASGETWDVNAFPCDYEADLLALSDLTEICRTAVPIRFRSISEFVVSPSESHRIRKQYRTLAVAFSMLAGEKGVSRHTMKQIYVLAMRSALPRYADIVNTVFVDKVHSMDIIRGYYQLSARVFDASLSDLIAFGALRLGDNNTLWPGPKYQRLYEAY